MSNNRETVQRPKWTKSKAYGLVSAVTTLSVLGAVATTTVQADENTGSTDTSTGATNLTESQDPNANAEAVAEAGQKSPELTVPVEDTGLNQAIEDAEQAGVVIETETTPEVATNFQDASNKLNEQEKAVEDATQAQKEVDALLDKAKADAEVAGVVVTEVDNNKPYENIADAKADANNQVADLGKAIRVSEDRTLDVAVANAQTAGVSLTKVDGTPKPASEAMKVIEREAKKLNDFALAQTEIKNALTRAKDEARAAGVVIEEGEIRDAKTIEEARALMTAIIQKVKEAESVSFDKLETAIDKAKAGGLGVTVIEGDELSPAEATKLIESEAARLDSYTSTQKEVNDAIKRAVDTAKAAGVTVNEGTVREVANAEQARAELDKIVKQLQGASAVDDSALTTAETKAKEAGVKVTSKVGEPVPVDRAKELIQSEIAKLDEFTRVQGEINDSLKRARDTAKQAGVTLTDGTVRNVTSAEEARTVLQEILAGLEKSTSVSDAELETAKATATQAGVKVVSRDGGDLTPEQAKAKIQEEITKLNALATVQKEINDSLKRAIDEAKAAGVVVTTGGAVKEVRTAEEARAELEKIKQALTSGAQSTGFNSKANEMVSVGQAGGVDVNVTPATTKFATTSEAEAHETAELAKVRKAVSDLASANQKLTDAKKAYEGIQGLTIQDGGAVKVAQAELTAKADELATKLGELMVTIGKNAPVKMTLEQYKSELEKVRQTVAQNRGNQEDIDRLVAGLQTTLPNDGNHNGYTPSGTATHLKADGIDGFKAVSGGELTNPTVILYREDDKEIDPSTVVVKVSWGDAPLELVSSDGALAPVALGLDGSGGDGKWIGVYNYNPNNSTSRVYEVTTASLNPNAVYRIRNAVHLGDGSIVDAILRFDKDYTGLDEQYQTGRLVVWNDEGTISAYSGRSSTTPPGNGVRLILDVGSLNSGKKYHFFNVLNDIDGGQYYQGDDTTTKVLAVGGGLSTESTLVSRVASNEELGINYGIGSGTDAALQGYHSIPDGAVVTWTYAESYTNVLRNTEGGYTFGLARSDFGNRNKIDLYTRIRVPQVSATTTFNTLETSIDVTSASTSPTATVGSIKLVTEVVEPGVKSSIDSIFINAEVTKPAVSATADTVKIITEVTKPVVNTTVDSVRLVTNYEDPTVSATIDPVTLKATVTPVVVPQRPSNHKSVTNEDGVDINNFTVPKGSIVEWLLQDSPLVAGRDEVISYTRTDVLPEGFELNLSETVKASRDYTFRYDAKTRTLTATATAGTVANMNADVTQQFSPVATRLIGTVVNDNAVYKNVFTTTINFRDVKIVDGKPVETTSTTTYETTSNVVVVSTPEKPDTGKENKNLDGVNIDGTVVPLGSTNVYELNWDLSKYKGTVADSYTIAKGFAFVDDYPEKAVDIVTEGVKFADATGKAVTGIEVKHFDSIETADQATKDFLKSAGITPDGAFQLFVATDSEAFFNNYVSKGISIKITDPMKIKSSLYGVDTVYTNKPYQIDFGNGYAGELVTNKVVTPEPEKENQNLDGIVINGKQLAVGMTNNYKLTWDLSKYAGAKPTAAQIAQGFYLVDDYPEEAVNIITEDITLVASNGAKVEGVSVRTYTSVDQVPPALKAMLQSRQISPKGTFQVFSADNPVDFYNKYVKTGLDIVVTDPMVVKDELRGKNQSYVNTVYQADFGYAYVGDTVTNNVVSTDPVKENLNKEGVDINGTPVAVGMTNVFKLKWDLDQFRGMLASNSEIAKGFFYIDDYPEEAVYIQTSDIRLVDSDGKAVTGVSVRNYANVAEAPELVKSALAKWNVKPSGAFQVFSADNAQDFYKRYVQTGKSITIFDPMVVKDELKDTGGSYKNTAFQLEFGNVNVTETVGNDVPKVEPVKKNLNGEGVDINGTIREIGMVNYYTLNWDLDQYKGVLATASDIAKGFYMVDDFPEEAVSIVTDKVAVLNSAGQKITDVAVNIYNALSEAPENVRTALTKWGISPVGKFQVFSAVDPMAFYKAYVQTGSNLTVVTPMMVREDRKGDTFKYENTAYQINFGNAHATATVVNNVVPPKPQKDNFNLDNVIINGTPTVLGMTNNYKLTWDLDQYRGIKATAEELASGFYFVDDFPEEVVTINSANVTLTDSTGAKVTGVSVRQYASINEVPATLKATLAKWGIKPQGAFQVFSADDAKAFYDAYVTTGKNINIVDPMVVKKDLANVNHTYSNTAYQVGFNTVYETKTVENPVPSVDPEKLNLNLENVDINGTPMYVGAVNNYTLNWDLNQFKGIKADRKLVENGFYMVDDFPEEAVTIDSSKVRVLTQTGHDVTDRVVVSQYAKLADAPENVRKAFAERNISPKGAFQVISAKDVHAFYAEFVQTGTSLKVIDPMIVKPEMKDSNKSYVNTAYQLNFGTAYVTETVENFVPSVDPTKHNENLDGVNIDGNVMAVGMVNNYKLKWNLNQYKGIKAVGTDVQKGFFYIDDYQEDSVEPILPLISVVDGRGVLAEGIKVEHFDSIEKAPKAIQTWLKAQGYTVNGAFQLFTATDPADFYSRYVQEGRDLFITTPMEVKQHLKDTGGTYTNTGFQIGFGLVDETPVVTNEVPKVNPTKADKNADGEDINKTAMAVGMTNQYELTWTNAQYKGIEADKGSVAKGFFFVDDFDETVLDIKDGLAYVKDSAGRIVEGITVTVLKSILDAPENVKVALAKAGYSSTGAIQLFTANNPTDFYNKYVRTGTDLTIVTPMTIKESLKGNGIDELYRNVGYQINFGNAHVTNVVENTVPEVDPEKRNENADGVDINGTPVAIGFVNHFKLTWDFDQYKGIKPSKEDVLKGFFYVDDFPEEAVEIVSEGIKLTDSKGQPVTGVTATVYESIEQAPEALQATLKAQGISPKGAFQVFTADNPVEFFTTYVKEGNSITITDPMLVKDSLRGTEASYQNTAYQIEFGVGYVTETTTNDVPVVTPVKENFNKAGVNIDGKEVLAGSVNYYRLTWDLDQYKGMKADAETIERGFFYVDDYPQEAVEILSDQVRFYTESVDENGVATQTPVEGIEVAVYENFADAPEKVRKALEELGYTPKGAFQVFTAVDPVKFYETYVATGTNIIIVDPMKVKEEMAKVGGKYENQAIQIDFGKAHLADLVVNNVPKFEASKDVLVNGVSVDGGVITLGQIFAYTLDGALIPANRSEDLFEYRFTDKYQGTHDRFTGEYSVTAKVDFKLRLTDKDGKVTELAIKAGDDLTKYTTLKHDAEGHVVDIDFTDEFYKGLDNADAFRASAKVIFERIAVGEVKNTFINTVNGVEVISNTVVTTTPQPPAPEEPGTPAEPTAPQLPNTGDGASSALTMMGILAMILAFFGIHLKKKRDDA